MEEDDNDIVYILLDAPWVLDELSAKHIVECILNFTWMCDRAVRQIPTSPNLVRIWLVAASKLETGALRLIVDSPLN